MMGKERGAVLFETSLAVLLLAGLCYWGHCEVVARWERKWRELETLRLPYDGEILWKP